MAFSESAWGLGCQVLGFQVEDLGLQVTQVVAEYVVRLVYHCLG